MVTDFDFHCEKFYIWQTLNCQLFLFLMHFLQLASGNANPNMRPPYNRYFFHILLRNACATPTEI